MSCLFFNILSVKVVTCFFSKKHFLPLSEASCCLLIGLALLLPGSLRGYEASHPIPDAMGSKAALGPWGDFRKDLRNVFEQLGGKLELGRVFASHFFFPGHFFEDTYGLG